MLYHPSYKSTSLLAGGTQGPSTDARVHEEAAVQGPVQGHHGEGSPADEEAQLGRPRGETITHAVCAIKLVS